MCYSVEQFKVMINHNDLSDIQLFVYTKYLNEFTRSSVTDCEEC